MDLLQECIHKLFFRYFFSAFGGACISCIYGIVDMAVVGQYHGPEGTAAMCIAMPVFNIIYSLGLFAGIGGAVHYSTEKGKHSGKTGSQNEYFTAACIIAAAFSLFICAFLFIFEENLLILFGADEALLPLAKQYMVPVRFAAPVFLGTQTVGAFLRNDDAPGLATTAVLISGIFNVFGDFFFVFVLDLGILGAGIATCAGGVISLCIMSAHFLSVKNTLRFSCVHHFTLKVRAILSTGFSAFFTDISLGIVTVLFNRQIMEYMDTNALSVFGILMNINTFVQCCGYSIGQAAQPILSTNFGAGNHRRIKETLKYALATAAVFGILWILIVSLLPNTILRLFMAPTKEVLLIAPGIMRSYAPAFLLLPFNVFSTYYFQSVMKPADAFAISLGRGLVISGAMILVLPVFFGADALWLALPVTEGAVAIYAVARMKMLSLS